MKRAVVPLHWAQHATTGRAGRTDRTRCTASDRPALSMCPPEINHDRLILQRSLHANSQPQSIERADRTAPAHAKHQLDALHAMTGRDSASVRSWSRELPSRPDAPRVQSSLRHALLLWVPDRMLRFHEGPVVPVANPNTHAPDCYIELTGHVRSNRDRVRCSVRSPW
jgi:hypothetical protein